MNRRSIQSFQRQTQAPSADQRPREATAYRSPVLTRLRNRRCGRKGRNGLPRSARRRFAASGLPWRTAKTPAFSRGWSSTAATSPAANTPGCDVDCNVASTAMNPVPSTASPDAAGQGGGAAAVAQTTSSTSKDWPSTASNRPASTRATRVAR